MTILIAANVATAAAAVLLMLLVTIGFAPHLRMWGYAADNLMSIFVAGCSGLVWVRLLWWSLLRPAVGWLEWLPQMRFTISGQITNTGFNLWAVVVALAALGALHRSLPYGIREQYNWFTAPFYPRRFPLIWRW